MSPTLNNQGDQKPLDSRCCNNRKQCQVASVPSLISRWYFVGQNTAAAVSFWSTSLAGGGGGNWCCFCHGILTSCRTNSTFHATIVPASRSYSNFVFFWSVLTFKNLLLVNMGRDSSVGIATRYGLDGPGIESRGGEIFHNRPDRSWGPTVLLYNGYRVFPGVKGPEPAADHPPHLVPR